MHGQHAPLLDSSCSLTDAELDAITATMPLTARYSIQDGAFDGWALLFRDHYLEHSVGFVLAAEHSGLPPEWIFALAKGDRTRNRERIHSTFLARGYRSTVFDNAWIDVDPGATRDDADQAELVSGQVDEFIVAARSSGRKVLAIDDGGLLARGYGQRGTAHGVDAALELTVSGLKRITAAGPLGIPVWNMARSTVKTRLGYPEIADSCLRRFRALLPTVKVIGRGVLLLGFGTLGSRLAPMLRAQGCRVCIVDTDIIALITAAEAGYCAHRTAAEALRCARPFAVLGTTGEVALTRADLDQLPDGAYLAPFATRDFSVLRTPGLASLATDLPGVGRRYAVPGGPAFILLGDGRSMNLFEADSIPNQGYDAYRAGTLIAARALCSTIGEQLPGVSTEAADAAIAAAGLYDAYFDLYLSSRAGSAAELAAPGPRTGLSARERRHACVVGYGAAGRLHADILGGAGMRVTIIDPKHHQNPAVPLPVYASVEALAAAAGPADLWSICAPTGDHLPLLRQILDRDPNARVLLEKPACHGHEIPDFEHLINVHPHARIVVNDQYSHSRPLNRLGALIGELAPGQTIDHIMVTFTKDRRQDISTGRFVDRIYGVLGYEWLHMLAVVRQILPSNLVAGYLAADPARSDLYATYDDRLFVSSLTERSTLGNEAQRVYLELASSITGPLIPLVAPPAPGGRWQRALRADDDRHRHVTIHAGSTRFGLHLEPVTAPGGWQLDRNQHRLTADQKGNVVFDQIIDDSPMHTSIRHAVTALCADAQLPRPDLAPLRRIAALAATLRKHKTTEAAEHTPGTGGSDARAGAAGA